MKKHILVILLPVFIVFVLLIALWVTIYKKNIINQSRAAVDTSCSQCNDLNTTDTAWVDCFCTENNFYFNDGQGGTIGAALDNTNFNSLIWCSDKTLSGINGSCNGSFTVEDAWMQGGWDAGGSSAPCTGTLQQRIACMKFQDFLQSGNLSGASSSYSAAGTPNPQVLLQPSPSPAFGQGFGNFLRHYGINLTSSDSLPLFWKAFNLYQKVVGVFQ